MRRPVWTLDPADLPGWHPDAWHWRPRTGPPPEGTPAHPNPPQLPRDRRRVWSDDNQPAPVWTPAANAARLERAAAKHHQLGCTQSWCHCPGKKGDAG